MSSKFLVAGALAASPLPDTPALPRIPSRLWRVLTPEIARVKHPVITTSYDRSHRNPGQLAIHTTEIGVSVGLGKQVEGEVQFEIHRHVKVGRPEQLSFGQQAMGLFGDKSPGSPPLPYELMPGSSRVPQLRAPPERAGNLTGSAGYYNMLPFAGLVNSAGAAGMVTVGAKYKWMSEDAGGPVGLAVHFYLSVPIHKAVDFLMTHPVGTADLQVGFDGIVSKRIGNTAVVFGNAGFRHISQPAHASVFRLRDEVALAVGFSMPIAERLQLMAESNAEVFVGEHTANTSSGPESPLDVTVGVRVPLTRGFTVMGGLQAQVNQPGQHSNGLSLRLSYEPD